METTTNDFNITCYSNAYNYLSSFSTYVISSDRIETLTLSFYSNKTLVITTRVVNIIVTIYLKYPYLEIIILSIRG